MIKYTPDEIKAINLSLIWETLCKKVYPNINTAKLRTTGDPTKSSIFRYCYKLIQETRNLIQDDEYENYILAQLTILKSDTLSTQGLITPAILTGPKAWKRWKVYQSKLQKQQTKSQNVSVDSTKIPPNPRFLEAELIRSKIFLVSKLGQNYNQNDINQMIEQKLLISWVQSDKISPYYCLLSKLIPKQLNFGIDFNLYCVDDISAKIYSEVFNNEK